MSIESEVKFYVNDLPAIQSKLERMGAHLIQPRVLETNLRFDLPDGSLGRRSEALRLRQDTAVRITYKGPSQTMDGIRHRTELEMEVSDLEKARGILEALGYEVVATYEKYRQVYSVEVMRNDLHVFLDELPYGNFVEIEGKAPEAIFTLSKQLGLDMKAAISDSYLGLFRTLSAEYGCDPSQLTFAELDELDPMPEYLHVRAADG